MKKNNFYSLIFALAFVPVSVFSGCASVPSESSHIEKKQSEKKLQYDDWKYMGFGRQIPVWVEPAINGNIAKVKKAEEALAVSEILVLSARGVNIDQAEEALQEMEIPENYTVYDSFWVRQSSASDKPYIAVAIFKEDVK
ncbi:MAG: hypothetical protein K5786_03460 [Treponema sp.]|nr:hypothetical protein [Treponema sp.]